MKRGIAVAKTIFWAIAIAAVVVLPIIYIITALFE